MRLPGYDGGKSGNGVYQQIINHIPPHNIYIAPFAGHDGIFRKIRRADISILNDKDPRVCERWLMGIDGCIVSKDRYQGNLFNNKPLMPAVIIRNEDYAGVIAKFKDTAGAFIYCDPPYPYETRRSSKKLYLFDWPEKKQHEDLLSMAVTATCSVMISSYDNELYHDVLVYQNKWHYHKFNSMTRGGVREETIYMNYPKPTVLHDFQYLGKNYRERERIKKKVNRWNKKLDGISPAERTAILSSLIQQHKSTVTTLINL
jgi:DNA adenine methylase